LTVKALRALQDADVIFYDELVSPEILDRARRDASLVPVGRRVGKPGIGQDAINRLMIEAANSGQRVVRLKGGDPFVFGRGGEELEALAAAGIEVEVVPGVTAGIGVSAALGIPVTHRGLAQGVTFVTGHTRDGAQPNWAALAASGTTLVIYMGLRNLARIAAALKAAGMDPATPACIIENGTLPTQRQRICTLGSLSSAGFSGPATVVVGEVVRYARPSAVPLSRVA
jgi:uroporphyrin-III C-methyltransferase